MCIRDRSNGETQYDLNNLTAGTYVFNITDSNGCTESITVEITEPQELTISEVHSDYFGFGVECNGDSNGWIDVTANGGAGEITYLWDTGETTQDLENLSAGTYTITASDENNTEVSLTIEITESDIITIDEEHSNYDTYGVACYGDSNGYIDITVNGGTGIYNYTWSNNLTTEDLTEINAGTYSVMVSDENGCSETISVEITEPENPITITETHSDYSGYGAVSYTHLRAHET